MLFSTLAAHGFTAYLFGVINNEITHLSPCFGDHDLILVHLCLVRPPPRTSFRRSWLRYSPEALCAGLSLVDWSNNATDVQGAWDDFENKLIAVVDNLVPLSEFKNNLQVKLPSNVIKRKINLRKRLLKNFRRTPNLDLKS